MNKLKVKEMTVEGFHKYGSFANLINPSACKIGAEPVEFYRDMLKQDLGSANQVCFSTLRVLKRAGIIDNLEFHDYTGEGMLPLDGDIYLSVAPATANSEIPFAGIEVFRVPQGTMITIHPGVWHCAAYPVNTDCVNLLIALPERIYTTDCTVVKFPGDKYIEIAE